MDDKQRVRNLLSQIEDEARSSRNRQPEGAVGGDLRSAFHLVAMLSQVVRQELF